MTTPEYSTGTPRGQQIRVQTHKNLGIKFYDLPEHVLKVVALAWCLRRSGDIDTRDFGIGAQEGQFRIVRRKIVTVQDR